MKTTFGLKPKQRQGDGHHAPAPPDAALDDVPRYFMPDDIFSGAAQSDDALRTGHRERRDSAD
jgi:hypothetical protein